MCDHLESMFAGVPTQNCDTGAHVFRMGDTVQSMFYVRCGIIQLVRHTPGGRRLILHRAGVGQVLAEASAWSETYHCDAVVSVACRVSILPRGRFRKQLQADPVLADLWAGYLARATQAARLKAEMRSLPTVADRLDAWLVEGNELPPKGRWQEVAAELSVSKEAFYRELAKRRASMRSTAAPTSVLRPKHVDQSARTSR